MRMILFIAAAAVCLFLLRSVWRMMVEVPDADQVWAPDMIDAFLSRSISALLMVGCGLFLLVLA